MDDMTIRRATAADIPQIDELLRQVLEVHHAGRPDLFKGGVKKYTDEESGQRSDPCVRGGCAICQ